MRISKMRVDVSELLHALCDRAPYTKAAFGRAQVFCFVVNGYGNSWAYASPNFEAAAAPDHLAALRDMAGATADRTEVNMVVSVPFSPSRLPVACVHALVTANHLYNPQVVTETRALNETKAAPQMYVHLQVRSPLDRWQKIARYSSVYSCHIEAQEVTLIYPLSCDLLHAVSSSAACAAHGT